LPALALVAASWFLAQPARAELVALDASACLDVPEGEVRALLTLELPGRLLEKGAPEPELTEHVRVRCTAAAAELAREENGAKRTLSFEGVPLGLHARVLALAIAELLRPEEKQRPAEPVVAGPPKAPEEPAPIGARPDPRFHLWAGISGSALPLLSLGGSLLLRVSIRRLFAWSNAFDVSQVRTPIDRGQLRVQNISLRTGPALSFVVSPLTLLLGAGFRLSLLRLSGEASDPSATGSRGFDTWLVAPTLFGGAALDVGRGAFLALELEVGHALRRVRADVVGGGALTLSAWRASGVLGAGFQW
jgi:hypothetical protein